VGTLLGPKVVTRELVAVTGNDDRGVTVGYATTADIAAVSELGSPRSVLEATSIIEAQAGERRRFLRAVADGVVAR